MSVSHCKSKYSFVFAVWEQRCHSHNQTKKELIWQDVYACMYRSNFAKCTRHFEININPVCS